MKKYLFIIRPLIQLTLKSLVVGLLMPLFSYAGEWVTLEPQNLMQYEIAQAGALGFANEGLYVRHKTSFSTTLTCAKKEFVVITDQKLADRTLSSLMFATTTNKTVRFYVDGCNNDYLHGKIFMLIN